MPGLVHNTPRTDPPFPHLANFFFLSLLALCRKDGERTTMLQSTSYEGYKTEICLTLYRDCLSQHFDRGRLEAAA